MIAAKKSGANTGVSVIETHVNTDQNLISITEDRLRLRLINFLSKVEDSKSWQVPLGLVITIVLVFCSAEFKDALALPAATWRAIFSIGGVLCGGWLVVSLVRLRRAPTLDKLITSIKDNTKF